ncbi:efflux RND transporter periplasmic adaptor subunit [Pseudobacteriovorax antillogorgiicola]|uniref:Membrane fusion protein, Cu(I)/Ag(I) efflux system n=1 Tax=Pseudobacteriovorax antillogorgiicola TaxID=1513793 RepID=A0A1Y6C1S0_9BACT|nr:efflux RND transporter periplasmic adaptor subunit [Pseudobacteriovorax antillogorgiicola]TCS50739.1 Cu(I)/Ag(I) efflux system membrane fusion protein [Pseudobacteriovorax antillogorgiicola]SMF41006.1 membrane fusion protein, Cu(I)/Ag(I) efflux system [Pseudobacteriovorax antillogorgiicola]
MNKKLLILLAGLTVSCTKSDKSSRASSKAETVQSDGHEGHRHLDNPDFYYTCAMHPEIRQSEPGKCPICGMTLTKFELDDDETSDHSVSQLAEQWQCRDYPDVTSAIEGTCPIDGTPMIKQAVLPSAGEAIAKVKLRKSQMSHFVPSFFPVSTMKMTKNVRLLGSVLQSEDKQSTIPARVGGRVEKVYIKSTGSFVKRGDPVLEIYSPKLITAGQEYLVSRRSFEKNGKDDFKQLLAKAQERLELWGIRRWQYESWYRNGKVPRQIVVYSPSTGIVQKHNAKVGGYFKEGQNFFELSDLSEVWVEMDVYEHDSSIVKLGQEVQLEFSSAPGKPVRGEIDFINPILDSESRTLKVRTTIPNAEGALKPGMIAEASLTVVFDGKPLVVPRTAIIDTGKRKVVWVKLTNKKFEAKIIHTGFESEGYVEVKQGLKAGDQVVMDGNFLLDAQAQLFGGYSDMTRNPRNAHPH